MMQEWIEKESAQRFLAQPNQRIVAVPNDRNNEGETSVPAITKDEMMRFCGIRKTNYFTGVKPQRQTAFGVLSENAEELPKSSNIHASKDRIGIKGKRQRSWEYQIEQNHKDEILRDFKWESYEKDHEGLKFNARTYGKTSEGRGGESKGAANAKGGMEKKNNHSDKMRRTMLRNYLIKELAHEDGKRDPMSHFRLVKKLAIHELTKPLKKVGKKLVLLLLKALGLILGVLLQIVILLLPWIFLFYLMFQPMAYFHGLFQEDEVIMSHPQNMQNVLQEMYTEFYGDIDLFGAENEHNQTEYVYGEVSPTQSNEILAAYLAIICKEQNYDEMFESEDGYPPYLLVDTEYERMQLIRIFQQFNYTETEDMTVRGTDDNGVGWEEQARKMKVFCLTAKQWGDIYLSELSGESTALFEQLLAEVQSGADVGMSGITEEGDVLPITEIKIPEGVDENLVYMAGFLKAEAGNQAYQGKIAVAYVILNRAGGASGNIKGVLTAPYQFSCYIPYHTVEKFLQEYASMTDEERAQDACWNAAAQAYYGVAENPIGTMKYYCNPKYCSVGETEQWGKIRARNKENEIMVIGDHVFCQNCW